MARPKTNRNGLGVTIAREDLFDSDLCRSK